MIHRIRTRAEFDRIGRAGNRARNEWLWCSHLPDLSVSPPRVAFAIGRAHGPAVTRNRLRRRLRPILSEMARDGVLTTGHLLVGINRSTTDQVFSSTTAELRAAVMDVVTRASRLPTA